MSQLEAAKARLPKAPERQNYPDDESFEEARGYWQGHVGRILGLMEQLDRAILARSKLNEKE